MTYETESPEKFNRRATDVPNQNARISVLIEQASDPKDRAFLVVLQSINSNAIQNGIDVKELEKSLKTHLTTYAAHIKSSEEMVNKVKGMWKIIAWIIGAVQAAAIAVGMSLISDMKQMRVDETMNELIHQKSDMRMTTLEKRQDDLNIIAQRYQNSDVPPTPLRPTQSR